MKNFIEYILNHPKKIVTFFIFFSTFSILYSSQNLKINTSTDNLISNDLDFKKIKKKLKNSFKLLNHNLLIRIKFINTNHETQLIKSIQSNLKSSEFVSFVYSPNTDEVFKENFFFF